MLPFLPFDPAAITTEIDAVSRCNDFGCSVLFGLLQFDNATTPCSTGSQEGVHVIYTVNADEAAVRTLNVLDGGSSNRDLALAAL